MWIDRPCLHCRWLLPGSTWRTAAAPSKTWPIRLTCSGHVSGLSNLGHGQQFKQSRHYRGLSLQFREPQEFHQAAAYLHPPLRSGRVEPRFEIFIIVTGLSTPSWCGNWLPCRAEVSSFQSMLPWSRTTYWPWL